MTPSQFISTYEKAIVNACMGTSLFPSVKMAQMALETGWGKSIPGKNAFGIKAAGKHTPYWKGDVYNAQTKEVIQGNKISIVAGFRAYQSVQDSILDHNYFLKHIGRYRQVFTAGTPEAQAQALQSAGYATDPGYAVKLINLINKYDLKRLDEKKKLNQPGA